MAVAVVVTVVVRGGDGLSLSEEDDEALELEEKYETKPLMFPLAAPGPGVVGLLVGAASRRGSPPELVVLGLWAVPPPPVRGCPPGPGVVGLLTVPAPVRGCPFPGEEFREEREEVLELGL